MFAAALRVMFQDMQRANYIGRSLDNLLQDGVRMAYDKHMDANGYVGIGDYGTTGLVNNPDATETTAVNGAKGTAAWATKTGNPQGRERRHYLCVGRKRVRRDCRAQPHPHSL